MRNYVIINGVNSLTIKGLAINELPPIIKPQMRSLREEIDGRDGDIITELGYSAYDKEMTIGLYDGYDIDEIIAFFNGEGTIVFSNESDKYYNFKILEQIDYEALIKYRTALVTIHCQPFKYPVEEEPIEVTYTYVEGEGETLTLTPTSEAPMEIDLKGNTSQYTTTGKNLIPDTQTTQTINGVTLTNIGGSYKISGTATAQVIFQINPLLSDLGLVNGEAYTYSANQTLPSGVTTRLEIYNNNSWKRVFVSDLNTSNQYRTATLDTTDGNILRQSIIITSGTSVNINNLELMLEKGSQATSYEPYTGGNPAPNPSYPQPVNVVTGDNTIEICGKNLFKEWISGSINPSTGVISSTARNLTNPIKVQPNTTYTMWREDTGFAMYSIEFDKNDNWLANNTMTSANTSQTFTTNANTSYVRLYQYTNYAPTNKAQLEKSSTATEYEPYKGQTYPIYLGVENLLKYPYRDTTKTENGITFTDIGDGTIKVNGTASANTYFYLTTNNDDTYKKYNGKKLTISGCPSGGGNNTYQIGFYNDNFSVGTADNGNGGTFTGGDVRYNQSYIRINSGVTCNELIFKPQLELGTKKNSYTPYGTTPIELCKIGDYQDYIYKDNGSWYIHKEIGKVVLDGSESWTYTSNTLILQTITNYLLSSANICLSNYYLSQDSVTTTSQMLDKHIAFRNDANSLRFYVKDSTYSSATDFQTWLNTHNTIVYYVLATPTNTEITDTTLISQLDNIQGAMSYKGQTNIMQVPYDKPFILKVKASKDDSGIATINNIGNIYSKPTIDIEGSGNVNVYLNGNQLFVVNVTDEVVIDSTNLEAYNPNTSALENRNVTGNIGNLKLNKGNNTIAFSGGLTKATITDYVRYL